MNQYIFLIIVNVVLATALFIEVMDDINVETQWPKECIPLGDNKVE